MSSDQHARGRLYLPDETRQLGTGLRSPGQNHVVSEERRSEQARDTAVRIALRRAFEHLAHGRYRTAGYVLDRRLRPRLGLDFHEIGVADDALAATDLPWFPVELEAFVEEPDRYLEAAPDADGDAQPADPDPTRVASVWASGGQTATETAKQTISCALQSCESLAIARGIIDAQLQRASVVLGHSQPLGVQWQQWEMNFPDPVHAVDRDKPVPFGLSVGQRGSGKSTFTASEVMDRYTRGDKILDLHDKKKLESGVYDIDQQQATLRRIRGEMGLPETISDAEFPRPDVEILVPIHRGLADEEVLFDDGECRVQPFAIDPASVPHRVFDAWLGSTTKKQQQELDRARRQLPSEGWTLRDLAELIRDGDAEDRVKSDLISMLEGMQEAGWVRDAESEYLIDWDRIYNDTDTITVFSTSLMDDERDKMRVFLWLLATVFETRDRQTVQYPRAAAVIRELHHVAPVQTNRKEDKVLKRLQKIAASEMRENASEGRHINLEILADTQHWGQIAKRMRQHVSRVAMFTLQYDSAASVFDEIKGKWNHSWVQTVRDHETGECTILADNGRIHGDDGSTWDFLQPVQAAPPPCHQVDTDNEPSGWACREWYTDEELDSPPDDWRIRVPTRLKFGDAFHAESEEDDVHEGVAAFTRECLVAEEGARIGKDQLIETYERFAKSNGHESLSKRKLSTNLGKILGGAFKMGSDAPRLKRSVVPSTPHAYGGVRFTDRGDSIAPPLTEVYDDAFDDDAIEDHAGGVVE